MSLRVSRANEGSVSFVVTSQVNKQGNYNLYICLLGAAAIIFRCDLLVLIVPSALFLLMTGRLRFTVIVRYSLLTGLFSLGEGRGVITYYDYNFPEKLPLSS